MLTRKISLLDQMLSYLAAYVCYIECSGKQKHAAEEQYMLKDKLQDKRGVI